MRIGVDGCRGGWFAAAVSDDGCWRTAVVPGFEGILGVWPDAELILVDIPIGLPAGTARRRCDVEARRRLGPGRGSSVFPAPPRAVLDAGSWDEALALARAASGRGISLQAWHLVPKIREVDALVRETSGRGTQGPGSRGPGAPGGGPRIREAHPELLFQGLAGGEPVQEPKRSPEGFARRLALLEACTQGVGAVVDETLARWPRRILARDDVLDALAAAWVAWCSREAGRLTLDVLPANPGPDDIDAAGIPMEIVAGVRG